MGVVHPGARNPNWKGGRTIEPRGYVLVKRPDHPNADVRGYVYEHRLVAEAMLGRRLRPGEEVHHKNGNTTDNRQANLQVVRSAAEHCEADGRRNPVRRVKGQSNPTVTCACGCGSRFQKFDSWGRPRRFVSGHNGR